MKHKLKIFYSLLLILALAACSTSTNPTQSGSAESLADAVATRTAEASQAVTAVPSTLTDAAALAANSSVHDAAEDYSWEESAVAAITLNRDSITADSPSVEVSGNTAVITSAGTYRISGTLGNGQIQVDTEDEETVQLILNGVDITNASSAAIFISKAEKVVVVLAEGTQNTLTDGSTYVFASADEDEPNATLFSKADLTVFGSGSLVINANYNDGINSKDGLIISSGTITVNAVDDGIRGKDYLVIKNGTLTVTAVSDGLKSDNEEDTTLGFIEIENGTLNITSGGDAINAQTNLLVSGGTINITAGGGSNGSLSEDISTKGIKGLASVTINGGNFNINASDDAIHSNGTIQINGGTFTIASGDDGIHADSTITITNGNINISESYEGIESTVITISDGVIHVNSADDGINIAGGVDGSGGMMPAGMGGRGNGGIGGPGGGGTQPGGNNIQASNSNYILTMNSGYIYVDANGDGLDVNGGIVMTGGIVIVNGPTMNGNGALDYDSGFSLSGGTLLAVGSAGMAMAPDNTSTQSAFLVNFASSYPTGTLIHVETSNGEEIFTFAPTKEFQSVVYSSATLQQGEKLNIYIGGNASGTASDGLYSGGSYSGGNLYSELTLKNVITSLGGQGGFRR